MESNVLSRRCVQPNLPVRTGLQRTRDDPTRFANLAATRVSTGQLIPVHTPSPWCDKIVLQLRHSSLRARFVAFGTAGRTPTGKAISGAFLVGSKNPRVPTGHAGTDLACARRALCANNSADGLAHPHLKFRVLGEQTICRAARAPDLLNAQGGIPRARFASNNRQRV